MGKVQKRAKVRQATTEETRKPRNYGGVLYGMFFIPSKSAFTPYQQ